MEEKQKHRSKLLGWLSAGCALALVCACLFPCEARAQDSATASSASTKSKTATKSSASAAPSGTAKSTAKSTHPAAVKQSSTAVARGKSKRRRKTVARGQQKIDPERAEAIQEALIREHYLSGTAAGSWNPSSEAAMRRYQADHGWQSKTVPDSRALISLGLGPSHDHLLNPDSAMTTGPSAPRAASLTPASHSPEPGARISTGPATTSDQSGSGPQ